MKKISVVLSVVVALVLGLAGGYFWGYARGGAAVTTSYAPKIAALATFFPPAPSSTLSLSGQVESINGSIVTINARPFTRNPFAAGGFLVSREATVTSATKITKQAQIDPTVFRQEIQAYNMTRPSGPSSTTAIALPTPFTETNISLSDIKVGDMIAVTASSNIMSAASFTATTVQDETQL